MFSVEATGLWYFVLAAPANWHKLSTENRTTRKVFQEVWRQSRETDTGKQEQLGAHPLYTFSPPKPLSTMPLLPSTSNRKRKHRGK